MEHIGSYGCKEADKETQQECELFIGDMSLTPLQKTLQQTVCAIYLYLFCH